MLTVARRLGRRCKGVRPLVEVAVVGVIVDSRRRVFAVGAGALREARDAAAQRVGDTGLCADARAPEAGILGTLVRGVVEGIAHGGSSARREVGVLGQLPDVLADDVGCGRGQRDGRGRVAVLVEHEGGRGAVVGRARVARVAEVADDNAREVASALVVGADARLQLGRVVAALVRALVRAGGEADGAGSAGGLFYWKMNMLAVISIDSSRGIGEKAHQLRKDGKFRDVTDGVGRLGYADKAAYSEQRSSNHVWQCFNQAGSERLKG